MNFETYAAYRVKQIHRGIKTLELVKAIDFENAIPLGRILRVANDKGILKYLKTTRLDGDFRIENVTFSKRKDELQFFREIEIVYNKTNKQAFYIRIGCIVYQPSLFEKLENEGFFDNVENLSYLFVLVQNGFRALHDMNTKRGIQVIFEEHKAIQKMLTDLDIEIKF